jgi:hypothetical protein
MKLNEKDLKTITASLVVSYMGKSYLTEDETQRFREKCGELHDRIQVIRRKNGTFVSVD